MNSWYPGVIKEFNKIYPDIKVEMSTSKSFQNDIRVKMAANDLPDLVTFNYPDVTDEQRKAYFLPLNGVFPFIKDWEGNDAYKGSDGRTYALTYGLVADGLIYNKAIFKSLGIDPPATLDALIAAGKKIKASGKIGLVGCSQPVWTYWMYEDLAWTFMNDKIVTQKKMLTQEAPFTPDNGYVKSMLVLKKITDANIFEDDTVSYAWEPFRNDFRAGKSGMYYGGVVMCTQLQGPGCKLADMGFTPFPYDNSGGSYRAMYAPDWGLGISKNTKNLAAVKLFYAFLMDKKYKDYAGITGVISARKSVTLDLPFVKEFEAKKPFKVFIGGDAPAFTDFKNKAQIDFQRMYQEIGVGLKTPQQQIDMLNQKWARTKAGK